MAKIRKDFTALSTDEKDRIVRAILHMKNGGTDLYTKYVDWHLNYAGIAHSLANFLAWHRVFVLLFEEDMRQADRDRGGDGEIALPYWNWTQTNSRNPAHSRGSIWRNVRSGKLVGFGPTGSGSDYKVDSGPFKDGDWNFASPRAGDTTYIRRNLGYIRLTAAETGSNMFKALPNSSDISTVLGIGTFDVSPYDSTVSNSSFRNTLEGWTLISGSSTPATWGLHNYIHTWVGGTDLTSSPEPSGTMSITNIAPKDPIFFLHHCYVDKIWHDWQLRNPARADQYPTDSALNATGNSNLFKASDLMRPWDGSIDSHEFSTEGVLSIQSITYSINGIVGPQPDISYDYQ